MITTDDDQIHNLAREYHDHGHENNPNLPRGRDSRNSSGFNYRMNEISAAIGISQLSKLKEQDLLILRFHILYQPLHFLKHRSS